MCLRFGENGMLYSGERYDVVGVFFFSNMEYAHSFAHRF